MVNWGIQHNISTILCLCISFGSIFLLCCGCFGKCVFLFVGTVSKFALYKGFDISAEFILFATHYITLVESPSSTQSLQFHHLRWWNWQTDSFYSFVFTWTNNISRGNDFYYNIDSRATQSNSVTYACSKSRWCTLALMAWANRFARILFFARAAIVSVGKNIQIFRDNNG